MSASQPLNEPIAIIGSGCRFPGESSSASKLWDLLKDPKDVSQEIGVGGRFNHKRFYHPEGGHNGTTNAQRAYLLSENVRHFDAKFFSIQPGEAEAIDPQQRILLEVVYEAVESAGLTINDLSGSNTSCYVGIMCQDFFVVQSQDVLSVPKYAVTGIAASNASSRVSYFFDWHGPSMTIDTACSSSMVCVGEAVQALRNGTSRVAVACGTNLLLSPFMYVSLSNVGMVSPTGRCHMWDEAADGYARGEGVGCLVLKKLSAAIEDGDNIVSVIREIGVNHDGKTRGLTMPSAEAQAALIRETYRRAGLNPTLKSDRCQYFEAHGTGTPIGDPRESEALDTAFFPDHDAAEGELVCGSIKTIIGHTEGCAGIAGLMKASLALQHSTIPPNLHFNRLNPALEPFTKYLRIPTSCEPWPKVPDGQPRRASVNSFGFGGANAHCILESYEPESLEAIPRANGYKINGVQTNGAIANGIYTNGVATNGAITNGVVTNGIITNGIKTNGNTTNGAITNGTISNVSTRVTNGTVTNEDISRVRTVIPFTFSATSVKSLVSVLDSLREYLEQNPEVDMPSLAHTLSTRRSALSLRGAIYASSTEQLRQLIEEKLSTSVSDSSTSHSVTAFLAAPSILGVFTGQGAQWKAMGSKLIDAIPIARKTLSNLDASLASLPKYHRPMWSLGEALSPDSTRNVGEAAISQPLCTAVQIVLVDLLQAAGIKFKAVVGHSSGEIAAAYAAGFLSAADAIRIAYYRGLFAKLASGPTGEKGGMIAAGTTFEDADELCQVDDLVERLSVAAYNSPSSVTLSGDVDAVSLAKDVFDEEKKFSRVLKVDTAYHSVHMQRCAWPYLKALYELDIQLLQPGPDAPQWFSSVYDSKVTTKTRGLNGPYWVENMTEPVLFYPAIKTCLESVPEAYNFVIEVGPHPALQGPAKESIQAITNQDIAYSGTLKRGADDVEAFAEALGNIWARFGPAHVDLGGFQKNCRPDVNVKAIQGLPVYPWTHETEYWIESKRSKVYTHQQGTFHDLLGLREPDGLTDEVRWRHSLNVNDMKWLSGHKLQGQVVFPATGYICMVSEAALLIAQGQKVESIDIFDLEIRKAIAIHDQGTEAILSFTKVTPSTPDASTDIITADFSIFSVAGRDSTQMALNCCGTVQVSLGDDYTSCFPARRPSVPSMVPVDVDRFYQVMKEEVGLGFDDAFKSLTTILRRAGYSTVTARNPSFSELETPLLFHPAMLDCGLQGLNVAFAAPGDGTLSELVAPTYFRRITLIPELLKHHMTDEVSIDSTNTDSRGMTPTGDVEVYTKDFEHKLIEMEGIKISPMVAPTADYDRFLFQESVMVPDKLDAQLARGGARLDPDEKAVSYDAERVAFYYLRKLVQTTSPELRAKLPRYRQCLLDEAERLYHQVKDGKHSFASPWIDDSEEIIRGVLDKYDQSDIDIALANAVGENLLREEVLTGEDNILQYMTKDNMLERYYTQAIGYPILNSVGAGLLEQLCHKFPRMNILEIGAGTGGSTAAILDRLGEAYASYTYTDISTGFFGAAGERFQAHSHKMDFKTLDISKDPTTQGFESQSYDVVIAQNVLHATTPLKETLHHARRLLKPGGYLINMELVRSDAMRFTLVVGSLPGWWVGEDDGRYGGPLLTPAGWKTILSETGFAVETISEQLDTEDAWAVMAARMVDDRVAPVIKPLGNGVPAEADRRGRLLVVGGNKATALALRKQVSSIATDYYADVRYLDRLSSLQVETEVPEGQHVLLLTECDTNLWETIDEVTFENLKRVLGKASSVLWLLQGSQETNPHAAVTVGFLRTVFYELPDTKMQVLDVGTNLGNLTPELLAECVLRLRELAEMSQRRELDRMLCTIEPEIFLKGNRLFVPRLKCDVHQNARYNSSKRVITRPVEIASSTTPLSLVWDEKPRMGVSDFKGEYILKEQHEFRHGSSALGDGDNEIVTILVSCSFLSSLKTPAGFFFVCIGTNTTTGVKTLCFSDRQASIVTVPRQWTVPLHDSSALEDVGFMSFVVVDLLAQRVLQLLPHTGSVVIFDANPVAQALLSKRLADVGKKVILITPKVNHSSAAIYLHPHSPKRSVDAALPSNVTLYIDASDDSSVDSAKLGSRISSSLSPVCEKIKLSRMSAHEASVLPKTAPKLLSQLLGSVADFASMFSQLGALPIEGGAPIDVLPLTQVLSSPAPGPNPNSLVYWQVDKYVPVSIEPVYMRQDLFRPDRTYWLAGLSGTLGQSLVDFMIAHNAKHIAISSRNPKAVPEWVDWHKEQGASVAFFSGDVTNFESVKQTYAEITESMPPIAGVADGAMVLIDSTFLGQRFEDFQAILKPKVQGTINLDRLFSEQTGTVPEPLDWFIGFSSLVAYTGNPGQAAYGAGNAFLKALIRGRRSRGLAGSTIDIGRMVGVGYIESELTFEIQERLKSRSGTLSMSELDLHQLFAEAVIAGRPDSGLDPELIAGVGIMKGDEAKDAFWNNNARMGMMIRAAGAQAAAGGGAGAGGLPLKKLLQSAKTLNEASKIIVNVLRVKLQGMKFLPDTDSLHDTTPLVDLGIDSLIAVYMRSWFQNELSVDVPVMKILGGASMADLVESVLDKLPQEMISGVDQGSQSNGQVTANTDLPIKEKPQVEESSTTHEVKDMQLNGKLDALDKKVNSQVNGHINGDLNGHIPVEIQV